MPKEVVWRGGGVGWISVKTGWPLVERNSEEALLFSAPTLQSGRSRALRRRCQARGIQFKRAAQGGAKGGLEMERTRFEAPKGSSGTRAIPGLTLRHTFCQKQKGDLSNTFHSDTPQRGWLPW